MDGNCLKAKGVTNEKLSVIAAAAVLTGIIALLAGGCASSRSGEVYSRDHARQAQTVMMGTVESVKSVTIEGTKTPVGTAAGGVAGGVLGSTVGGGSGRTVATVIGALAGAAAGTAAEEGMTRNPGWRSWSPRTPAPPLWWFRRRMWNCFRGIGSGSSLRPTAPPGCPNKKNE